MDFDLQPTTPQVDGTVATRDWPLPEPRPIVFRDESLWARWLRVWMAWWDAVTETGAAK